MAAFLMGTLLASAAQAASDMTVQWKDGLVLTSEDAQIKIGGRIMNDWAWLDGDDALDDALGNVADGTEFRRARVAISGTLQGGIEFKGQYDFAGAKVSFKDVYVGVKNVIGQTGLRIGQFKQPVGMDVLNSSNDILFMERASFSVLMPDRRTGLMLHGPVGESDRVTVAASVFRETDSGGKNVGDGAYSVAARVTGLALATEGGDLLHLGISGSLRNPVSEMLAFDLDPEAHLAPAFGQYEIDVDSWTQVGLEAAGVFGALHFQGEYLSLFTTGAAGAPDVNLGGFYAQAGFFLTGERLPYKKRSGTFTRVKPQKDFRGEGGGVGAVELVARYSMLDVDDEDAPAGDVTGITAGLNWYLNPNTRMMLNYVRSEADTPGLDGTLQGIQTRFQVAF
jgi:phosphate-selective porin OprO/OprP